jgi:threonine dehydratase
MQLLPTIDIAGIRRARSIIQAQAQLTPVLGCTKLQEAVNRAVFDDEDTHPDAPKLQLWFKCENQQISGSFKFRGAYHFLSQLSNKALRAGLVSYSTGQCRYPAQPF